MNNYSIPNGLDNAGHYRTQQQQEQTSYQQSQRSMISDSFHSALHRIKQQYISINLLGVIVIDRPGLIFCKMLDEAATDFNTLIDY